ncbi:unnamed protein product, partial [Mycena citricolor]
CGATSRSSRLSKNFRAHSLCASLERRYNQIWRSRTHLCRNELSRRCPESELVAQRSHCFTCRLVGRRCQPAHFLHRKPVVRACGCQPSCTRPLSIWVHTHRFHFATHQSSA